MCSCFPNLCRKKKQNKPYIDRKKVNIIGLFGTNIPKNKELLDYPTTMIWIVDEDLNILYGSYDEPNGIHPKDYIGKNMLGVEPAEIFSVGGNMLKATKDSKSRSCNMFINGVYLYLFTHPIIYFDNLSAYALYIIKYAEAKI
jgi:hypothetical protein